MDDHCLFANSGCSNETPSETICQKCKAKAHPYLLREAIKDKQLKLNADAREDMEYIENHAIIRNRCVSRCGQYLDQEWMHRLMDVRLTREEHFWKIEVLRDMNFRSSDHPSNLIDCGVECEAGSLCKKCLEAVKWAEQSDAEWFTKIFTPSGMMKLAASDDYEEEEEYEEDEDQDEGGKDDKTGDKKTTAKALLARTKRLFRPQQPQESQPNLVNRALTRLTSPRATRSYERLP